MKVWEIVIFILFMSSLQSCLSTEKIFDKAGVTDEECKQILFEFERKIYPRGNEELYGFKFDAKDSIEIREEYLDLEYRSAWTLNDKKDCLGNLTKKEIIKIYGKPPKSYNPEVSSHLFHYYLKVRKNCPCENCMNKYEQCDLLRFTFSKTTNKLESVSFLASAVGW